LFSAGVLSSEAKLVDILDKGKGALIIMNGMARFVIGFDKQLDSECIFENHSRAETCCSIVFCMLFFSLAVTTKNSSGEVVFINQFSLFVRGLGGFGGPSTSASSKVSFFMKSE